MPDLIGQQIGPYEIREKIASGGMATVYRAYQSSLERDVAVKVLTAALADDPQFVARFKREAMATARLHHQNILPVYDAGVFEGARYIVMEYAPRGTLAQHLETTRLTPDVAADMAAQIADALHYAHTRPEPIIHRDLKPSNILFDEDQRPMLADFGIAHVEAGSTERLTQTGASLGTPLYMSPEQGQGQLVDGRTDIYSLGVMLYQMVSGRVPFEGTTHYVIHQHLNLPPPQLDAAVPAYLKSIILRALAKRKEDRFATAGELAQALRQRRVVDVPPKAFVPLTPVPDVDWTKVASTPPPAAPAPPPALLPAKKPNRGLWLAVVAVLLVGAVVLVSAGYLLSTVIPRPIPVVAQVETPTPPATERAVAPPTKPPTPPQRAEAGGLRIATPLPAVEDAPEVTWKGTGITALDDIPEGRGYYPCFLEPLFTGDSLLSATVSWSGLDMTTDEAMEVWTLRVGEGATRLDGQPMVADDVIATVEAIETSPLLRNLIPGVTDWIWYWGEANDRSVRFTLRRPSPACLLPESLAMAAATPLPLVPTETFTPAPKAKSTATPTARPIATVTTPSSVGGVRLVSPAPDESVSGGGVRFAWWNLPGFALGPDEHYELVFWKLGQDPMRDGMSPVGALTEPVVDVNLLAADESAGPLGNLVEPGILHWGVLLTGPDYRRIRLLSESRAFTYTRPAGSEGGQLGSEPPPTDEPPPPTSEPPPTDEPPPPTSEPPPTDEPPPPTSEP